MAHLTKKEADVILAFLECYDLYGPAWQPIENGMREDFGVENPEDDIEAAKAVLQDI